MAGPEEVDPTEGWHQTTLPGYPQPEPEPLHLHGPGLSGVRMPSAESAFSRPEHLSIANWVDAFREARERMMPGLDKDFALEELLAYVLREHGDAVTQQAILMVADKVAALGVTIDGYAAGTPLRTAVSVRDFIANSIRSL